MRSLIAAFHTYSRIPMPQIKWDDKTIKNAICFFPCVGIAIGLVELLLLHIFANYYVIPDILRGAICCLVPFILTGGIHMDGFCDMTDALSSYQPRERKLEIMKDSNAGAFAVIYAIMYFILYFAAWIYVKSFAQSLVIAITFVMSRAFSGFGVATLTQARKKGMLQSYAEKADKKALTVIMLVYIVICSVGLLLIDIRMGVEIILVDVIMFAYYKYTAYKELGGITGDTAGWFLQLAELGSVLVVALNGVRFIL